MGEIGLDRAARVPGTPCTTDYDHQWSLFKEQMELAAELRRPVCPVATVVLAARIVRPPAVLCSVCAAAGTKQHPYEGTGHEELLCRGECQQQSRHKFPDCFLCHSMSTCGLRLPLVL